MEKPAARVRCAGAAHANWLRRARVQALDVLGFRTLLAGNDLEADLLALSQRLETNPDNRRVVDEDIRAAILKDKAEPMPVIEPFYFATGHSLPLPKG